MPLFLHQNYEKRFYSLLVASISSTSLDPPKHFLESEFQIESYRLDPEHPILGHDMKHTTGLR